jgi:hypothetical protein
MTYPTINKVRRSEPLTAAQWRAIGEMYERDERFTEPSPLGGYRAREFGLCSAKANAFTQIRTFVSVDYRRLKLFESDATCPVFWWRLDEEGALERANACYFIAAMIESGDA